jgi:hypothetical protein
LEADVRTKIKQCSLILCLFLFLFVVIGGGLHLNPGGALIAAATGTPLLVYAFNRRSASGFVEPDMRASREADGAMCRDAKRDTNEVGALDVENIARR